MNTHPIVYSLIFAMVIAIGWASLGAQAQQPNIVLFLVDDMGWTDWQQDAVLNPTGSALYETPNMLRLAHEGTVFNNAYAASPVCSPTRAAILTGKSPARLRITDFISGTNTATTNLSQPNWTKNLPASELTLAESLAAAGYNTSFFGKWHMGQNGNPVADPLNNGFDVNVGGAASGNPGFAGGFFAGGDGAWAGMPGLDTPGTYPSDKYLSDALSEQAAGYIAGQVASPSVDPFFLMMSHYLVHTPIQAPASLVSKYTQKISQLQSQGVDLQGHDNATYAGMVEKMDDSLGLLLDRLDDPNGDGDLSDSIRNETVILFASDNGGLYASGGSPTRNLPLREGKGSVYEGGIREPFLVSWTGNAAAGQGVVTDARTSSHDIYPTVLEIAGVLDDGVTLQTPATLRDGVSIKAALEGVAFDRGFQFWHYPHISPQDNNSALIEGGTFVSAVREGDWKLLFFYDDRHFELYNLANDIGETNNVLAENDGIANQLASALHDYLTDTNAQMPINRATGQPAALPPAIAAILAGDFNNNGQLDVRDWAILRTNLFSDLSDLSTAAAYARGDINFDGLVNRFDYAAFRTAFEEAFGPGALGQLESGLVPEPSTAVLLALGFGIHCSLCPTRPDTRHERRTEKANRDQAMTPTAAGSGTTAVGGVAERP